MMNGAATDILAPAAWLRPYGSPPATWLELTIGFGLIAVLIIVKVLRDRRR